MSFFRSRLATPLYKNTGSVARDHLASERTFLAWIRTGLGFVALGIAVERFSQLDLSELLAASRPSPSSDSFPIGDHRQLAHGRKGEDEDDRRMRWQQQQREQDKRHSQILVGALMGLGAGSILYGTGRYFGNLRALEKGLFRPAFHGAAVMGAAVAGLAGGVYGSALARRMPERAGATGSR
jgi:uncharacterized membrane protein YidH (DUF202 family)